MGLGQGVQKRALPLRRRNHSRDVRRRGVRLPNGLTHPPSRCSLKKPSAASIAQARTRAGRMRVRLRATASRRDPSLEMFTTYGDIERFSRALELSLRDDDNSRSSSVIGRMKESAIK